MNLLWSGGLRSAISTSSLVRSNLGDCTTRLPGRPLICIDRSTYDVMLPLFKVCVNGPRASVHSNFPRHSCAYPVPVSCRFRRKRKHAVSPIPLEPRYSRSPPLQRTPTTRISYSRRRWGPRSCRGLRRVARQMTNRNVVGDAGGGISRHECQGAHSIGDSLVGLHLSVKYVDTAA